MTSALGSAAGESSPNGILLDLDEVVEQLCLELEGRIPRERIRRISEEVAAQFCNATVTAYIPLLVRRLTRERLRREIGSPK